MPRERLYCCFIAIVIFSAILTGCMRAKTSSARAVSNFYIPSRSEELYGTWANPEYDGSLVRQPKFVVHVTGYSEAFSRVADEAPSYNGVITIIKRWEDGAGNMWYKVFYRPALGWDSLELYKISKNNTVLEALDCAANISGCEESLIEENLTKAAQEKERGMGDVHYRIYYRQ